MSGTAAVEGLATPANLAPILDAALAAVGVAVNDAFLLGYEVGLGAGFRAAAREATGALKGLRVESDLGTVVLWRDAEQALTRDRS
jgi:hypothetical protein